MTTEKTFVLEEFKLEEFKGFQSYAEIPVDIAKYMVKIAGQESPDIFGLSLEDINGFLVDLREFEHRKKLSEWSDGWVL
jgi:hypothetical protein